MTGFSRRFEFEWKQSKTARVEGRAGRGALFNELKALLYLKTLRTVLKIKTGNNLLEREIESGGNWKEDSAKGERSAGENRKKY